VAVLADPNATWQSLSESASIIGSTLPKTTGALARVRELLRQEVRGEAVPIRSGGDPIDLRNVACAPHGGADGVRARLLVEAIASFGPASLEARPELLEAYHSARPDVSWAATWALAALRDEEVLPRLIDRLSAGLGNGSPACEFRAQEALEAYGSRARPWVPILVRLFEKRTPNTDFLPHTLSVIGDPAAVEPLGRSLWVEDHALRTRVLEALAAFGTAARSQLPAIESLVDNWAPNVRVAAAEALRAIDGREAATHVPRRPSLATPTKTGWDLVLLTGVVHLSTNPALWPPVPPECQVLAKQLETTGAVLVGGTCLLLTYGIERVDLNAGDPLRGTVRRLVGGRVLAVVTVHGRVLAITGSSLVALNRNQDGTWSVEPLARLPGTTIASGLDAAGDLVVMTSGYGYRVGSGWMLWPLPESERAWAASPLPDEPGGDAKGKIGLAATEGPGFVLRLDSTGRLAEAY
jgi:hypothetical protein